MPPYQRVLPLEQLRFMEQQDKAQGKEHYCRTDKKRCRCRSHILHELHDSCHPMPQSSVPFAGAGDQACVRFGRLVCVVHLFMLCIISYFSAVSG